MLQSILEQVSEYYIENGQNITNQFQGWGGWDDSRRICWASSFGVVGPALKGELMTAGALRGLDRECPSEIQMRVEIHWFDWGCKQPAVTRAPFW